MDGERKTIEFAEFAANCTDILNELGQGAPHALAVVKDGEVVALVQSPRQSIYGYMRGSVIIPEGFDLTAPPSRANSMPRQIDSTNDRGRRPAAAISAQTREIQATIKVLLPRPRR